MKKVIIAILLLIPILVILTISASGRLIASAIVEIPAEFIEIKHGGEEIKSEEIILEEQTEGKKYTLFCEVFPGIATDEIDWVSSNPEIAKIIPSETRKDAADVVFLNYGSVDITCTSKKNTAISARVTFYVTGKVPGYLVIGDYGENIFDEVSMQRYEVKNLLAQVKPAISVRNAKVQWSSSDSAVVKVDNNGVVIALAEGEAEITATVTASDVTVSKKVTVTVKGTDLFREKVVYVTDDQVDVKTYMTDTNVTFTADSDVDMIGTSTVDLTGMQDFDTAVVTAWKGAYSEQITIVKISSQSTLVFENLYSLKKGALSTFLALGTSNTELKLIAIDGSNPDITWKSMDPSVIRVENGRLFAVGSGETEIYGEAEGYVSERVKVQVTSTVEDFTLTESQYRDKVGLLQEKVFGNLIYKDGEYLRDFRLGIRSSYPKDVSIDSFTFESTNLDVATVDRSGLVTFAKEVTDGDSVTITATAYNQAGIPVRRSYTFNMINGVNIGIGVERASFDKSKNEKPNFAPYYDLQKAVHAPTTKTVILHTDVYYPSKAEGGEALKNITASIYGNGYKLDGQFFVESVEDDEMMILWDFDSFDSMPSAVDVTIRNLYLQATQPTTENSKETFEELNRSGGGAISLKGNFTNSSNKMKLTVKGCLFQYAYSHVNVAIGDVLIDGCILRNNSASAIVLQQSSYCKTNLKLKNCIFSHTIAPVAIACGNFNDVLSKFDDSAEGSSAEKQFGTFELEGQMFVYNWKKLEEVQMSILPQKLKNKNANILVGNANDMLATVIQQAFMCSSLDNLYIDENENQWLNFSFLVLGIWENMDPKFNNDNPNAKGITVKYTPNYFTYAEVRADLAPYVSTAKLLFQSIIDLDVNKTYHIVGKDGKGDWNTYPGETYEINDITRARLLGERV